MRRIAEQVVAVTQLARALLLRVREVQAERPLAPVGIVVGSQLLRRHLLAEFAALGGAANVHVLSLQRLAMRLCPDVPTDEPRGRGDVRAVLACRQCQAGYFAGVMNQPGFIEAWQRTLADLRAANITSATLSEKTDLFDQRVQHVRDLLAADEQLRRQQGVIDREDVWSAARCHAGRELPFTHLLLAGFYDLTPGQRDLLTALGRVPIGPVQVEVFLPAVSGEVTLPIRHQLNLKRPAGRSSAKLPGLLSEQVTMVRCLTPADEAAGGLAWLWQRCEDERRTSLHRCAILYRSEAVFGALVRSAAERIGMPIAPARGRTVASTLAGRSAAALLDLAEKADLASARSAWHWLQLGDADTRLAWARQAQDAGVTTAATWGLLDSAAPADGPQRSEALEDALSGRPPLTEQARSAAAKLLAWREATLAPLLAFRTAVQPDAGLLLHHLLAQLQEFSGRVPAEAEHVALIIQAWTDVIAALGEARLQHADFFWLLRRQLESELPSPPAPATGVFVGELNTARHVAFDLVVVLGLNEGVLPLRPPSDPLLTDDARSELTKRGAEIRTSGGQQFEEQALFELAILSARHGLRVSYSELEPSADRVAIPSPFLLELARQVYGDRHLSYGDLTDKVPRERGPAALAYVVNPADVWRMKLGASLAEEVPPSRVPRAIGRMARCEQARWHVDKLTPYHGRLSDSADIHAWLRTCLPDPLPLNAYALSDLLTCPQKFWLAHVLGLDGPERADEGLKPAELGRLVRHVLDIMHAGAGEPLDATLDAAVRAGERRLSSAEPEVLRRAGGARVRVAARALVQRIADPAGVPKRTKLEATLEIDGRHLRIYDSLYQQPGQGGGILLHSSMRAQVDTNDPRLLRLALAMEALRLTHGAAANHRLRITSTRASWEERDDLTADEGNRAALDKQLRDAIREMFACAQALTFERRVSDACVRCAFRDGCGVARQHWPATIRQAAVGRPDAEEGV